MGEEVRKSDLQELESKEPLMSEESLDAHNPRNSEFTSRREAGNEVSSRVTCPVVLQPPPHITDVFPVGGEISESPLVFYGTTKSFATGYDFEKWFSSWETEGCATDSENSNIPEECNLSDKEEDETTCRDELHALIVIAVELLKNIWKKLSDELCKQLESGEVRSVPHNASCALSHELSLPAATTNEGERVITVREFDVIFDKIEKTISSYLLYQIEADMVPLIPLTVPAKCGVGNLIASIVKEAMQLGSIEKMKARFKKMEGRISTDVKTILEDCKVSPHTPNADSPKFPHVAYRDQVVPIGGVKIVLNNTWEKFSTETKSLLEASLCGST